MTSRINLKKMNRILFELHIAIGKYGKSIHSFNGSAVNKWW